MPFLICSVAEASAAEKHPKQLRLIAICEGVNDKILSVFTEGIEPGKRLKASHKSADGVGLRMCRGPRQREAVRPKIASLFRSLWHILGASPWVAATGRA
jgi:hypothetical protein